MVKAIDTEYDGYRFRSRLEARWAVFFNTLGIKYEYEKEGYDLDGVWYLPDFWLPKQNCWVEIKPKFPTQEEILKCRKLANGAQKACLLIYGSPWLHLAPCHEQGSYWRYESFIGTFNPLRNPMLPEIKVDAIQLMCDELDGKSTSYAHHEHEDDFDKGFDGVFAFCPRCSQLGIVVLQVAEEDHAPYVQHMNAIMFRHLSSSSAANCPDYKAPYSLDFDWCKKNNFPSIDDPDFRLIAAYTAARQARFEHGEGRK